MLSTISLKCRPRWAEIRSLSPVAEALRKYLEVSVRALQLRGSKTARFAQPSFPPARFCSQPARVARAFASQAAPFRSAANCLSQHRGLRLKAPYGRLRCARAFDRPSRTVMAGTCPPRRPIVSQLTVAFRLFTSTTRTLPEAAPALIARCNRLRSSDFGKDGCDVLSFTKQPDDIEVVVSLEAEPKQWKLRHPPSPEARDVQNLPQHRPSDARLDFDLVKCRIGCIH